MRKIICLGWLVMFLPAMICAQEKVDAPVWNVGDKWFFTLGNIEAASVDPNSYVMNVSDDACKFLNQGFKAIIFEKSTLNRVGVLIGGKRKEYTGGLRRVFNFPLNVGKQWKDQYSGKRLVGLHRDLSESFTETYTVLGWEDLQVRAGKFRAIKLEYKHVTTASTSPFLPLPLERKSIFWYSPAVKYLIKCQYDKSFEDEFKNWELTSFKGKK